MKDEKDKTLDKEEAKEAPMTHYYTQNQMYADIFGDKNKEHSTAAYILMVVIPIILFVLGFLLVVLL